MDFNNLNPQLSDKRSSITDPVETSPVRPVHRFKQNLLSRTFLDSDKRPENNFLISDCELTSDKKETTYYMNTKDERGKSEGDGNEISNEEIDLLIN